MKQFRANGKLLLTAEYTVLKGALALAIPTRFGQKLVVEEIHGNQLIWQSKDIDGQIWFAATFSSELDLIASSDHASASQLKAMLKHAKKANPNFEVHGKRITTDLEFDRDWGLGSSSTFVSLLAQWAEIDAMDLFFSTQTGSGYDVVCAQVNFPVLYQLKGERDYRFTQVSFNPPFKDDLHFVYLGQKQKSAKEVDRVLKRELNQAQIDRITAITKEVATCTSLQVFEMLLAEHEEITSSYVGHSPVKKSTFSDYSGMVKSLGAWGGDFVLVTRYNEQQHYFVEKGFNTILSWAEMFGI